MACTVAIEEVIGEHYNKFVFNFSHNHFNHACFLFSLKSVKRIVNRRDRR